MVERACVRGSMLGCGAPIFEGCARRARTASAAAKYEGGKRQTAGMLGMLGSPAGRVRVVGSGAGMHAMLKLRARRTCIRRQDSPDAEKARGVCLFEPI